MLPPGWYIYNTTLKLHMLVCPSHFRCESVGLKLILPGSNSTDSECAEDSNITPILLAIGVTTAVVGVILGLTIIIIYVKVWKFRGKRYIKPRFMVTE